MSVCFYLACAECKKYVWVAQDGLSGFTFYSKDDKTMKALGEFLKDHALLPGHRMEFVSEHRLDENYEDFQQRGV